MWKKVGILATRSRWQGEKVRCEMAKTATKCAKKHRKKPKVTQSTLGAKN